MYFKRYHQEGEKSAYKTGRKYFQIIYSDKGRWKEKERGREYLPLNQELETRLGNPYFLELETRVVGIPTAAIGEGPTDIPDPALIILTVLLTYYEPLGNVPAEPLPAQLSCVIENWYCKMPISRECTCMHAQSLS